MQGRCGARGFGSSAQATLRRRPPPAARHRHQHLVFLKTARSAPPNGEPTRRACSPCVTERPMSSSAGPAHHAEPQPLPNQANRRCAPPSRPHQPRASCASACAQRPAPTTTAAPAPAQRSNLPSPATRQRWSGQFADEGSAKPMSSDTVVWVNLPSKVYHSQERGATAHEARCLHVRERSNRR